jgi:hypothetical protein
MTRIFERPEKGFKFPMYYRPQCSPLPGPGHIGTFTFPEVPPFPWWRKWQPINAWNQERLLKTANNDTVVFDAITTGNFGGLDAWLDESPHASLEIKTNHGSLFKI